MPYLSIFFIFFDFFEFSFVPLIFPPIFCSQESEYVKGLEWLNKKASYAEIRCKINSRIQI